MVSLKLGGRKTGRIRTKVVADGRGVLMEFEGVAFVFFADLLEKTVRQADHVHQLLEPAQEE